ncbi:ATP-binding protein [Brevundimonas sp. VNH65]|uniref:ATP-binding protein n=1 Tax=Brevundimonas sp. VNH65 TaxID=3400917 RepID=UPI003BFB8ED4
MPNAAETLPTDWSDAAVNRRETAIQRIGVSLATALIITPVVGAAFSVFWVTAYLAMQFVEIEVFKPLTGPQRAPLGRWRSVLGCVVLAANTTLYCVPAIPLWMIGGPMGGLAATVMLSAAILYSTLNAPASSRVLLCTVTPEFVFLGATPVFMFFLGAPRQFVITVTAAVVVFAAYCLVGWQKQTTLRHRDRLERAAIDERQRRAEREAERRSAYLAAVAHDLRTPIGAILTGAAELERGATDHAARSQTALITDAGLMMKALLDDLLDHSRLEAGAMSIEAADFNLRAMLAQTLRLWAGPIRGKGLQLRIEGAYRMPAMVRGDAMRLRQVLNNLISNAVKFTETGSITLRLRAWVDEPHGHAVLIEVADTGPGMRSEQLARLFTPFDQTEAGVSARHGGSGLGLSISRNLVELMGGRLVARSRPGEGACFTVSVVFAPATDATIRTTALDAAARADVARALAPLATSRPAATPSASPPAPVEAPSVPAASPDEAPHALEEANDGDGERPLRALVVDDHDINRRAVELILAPLGCEIASAADGLAALDLCGAQAFDVIFMDVRMPDLDGRETTRRLRAGGGVNALTPVIAVTADTAEQDIAACMAAGMTYFVSKPLTPSALLGALQFVLGGGEDTDEEVARETVVA